MGQHDGSPQSARTAHLVRLPTILANGLEGGKVTDKEKAAGVLPTPSTASKEQSKGSVSAAEEKDNPQRKAFATLQAKFALKGRELARCHRAVDGCIPYVVRHRGESRHFAQIHDVHTHLDAIGKRW